MKRIIFAIVLITAIVSVAFPLSVHAATDLNNDGYTDLIFTGWGSSSYASIYYGNSSGQYQDYVTLPVVGAFGVAVADLDNNGWQDIVFANQGGYTSYIYWGVNTHTNNPFQNQSKKELSADRPYGVSIADLDRDSKLDIVFSNSDANTSIYWGSDSYATPTTVAGSGATGIATAVAYLNNDTYPDLVSSHHYAQVGISWGGNTPPFSANQENITGTSLWHDVSVADMDNDGFKDIVLSDWAGPSAIFWGDISYQYTDQLPLTTYNAEGNAIADLDGGGALDIVFANHIHGNSYIYWGETDYTTWTELPADNPWGVAIGKVDDDAYNDIVLTGSDFNSYIYWGNSSGEYSTSDMSYIPIPYAAAGITIVGAGIPGDSGTSFGDVLGGGSGFPQEGEVPEPSTLLLLLPFVGLGLRRMLEKRA